MRPAACGCTTRSRRCARRCTPAGLALEALELLPRRGWAGGIRAAWTPGESGAARELDAFADAAVAHYPDARDRPASDGVSRLSPHLLIDWREGARWFWDTLVDADLANNTMGWQWAAGCGADAAPYFRIFNPVRQARRFDPRGAYVRRWIPELAPLPDAHLHAPWAAPAQVLVDAGVALGRDYPRPVVEHAAARERALAALAACASPGGANTRDR